MECWARTAHGCHTDAHVALNLNLNLPESCTACSAVRRPTPLAGCVCHRTDSYRIPPPPLQAAQQPLAPDQMALLEGQLTWLVYIVAAVVKVRRGAGSG